jgi:Na+/H+ antiporter NhaD/arsenite permease-like protein
MPLPSLLAAAIPSQDPNPLLVIPFGVLLLLIATGPMLFPGFWERWYHLIAVGLGSITAGYYLLVLHAPGPLLHSLYEYFAFIALIGSLFVISGGIHITVKGEATPVVNCVFLLIGACLVNVVGTTGASMLLIRPWIRMNKYRITGFHIVFFIFIVSNVGGSLTPIGDPPLFLGYLRGVPFWWTLEHCSPAWAVAVMGLIGIFYVFDRRNFLRAPKAIRAKETASEEWKFQGLQNVFFLALVLVAVFISKPLFLRELIMIGAAAASFVTTRKSVHEANDFSFHPVKEVAWLFAGIFTTMIPVLHQLTVHAEDLGLKSPMQFYWFTGLLSGVLDNAPTYLAFLSVSFGLVNLDIDSHADVLKYVTENGAYLLAVSLGAVFFGAMTYIGNGPNLMVRSIAQHSKVKTPGFLGYIFWYALPVLVPLYAVIGFLFFR